MSGATSGLYWEALSMFESRDYVTKWYKERHSRELNAKNATAINACMTQGREYFEAADVSAASVKPLLQYYAVLSVSRGLILLRDPTKKEENLKPSHGIEVVDWGGTFAKGLENVLDLKIRATNGTFGELVTAVGNVQATAWRSRPNFSEGFYSVTKPLPTFTEGKNTITLDDFLSRDHRLLALYPNTTGRELHVHLGEVVSNSPSQVGVSIFNNFRSDDDVRKRFAQPSSCAIERRAMSYRLPIPNTHFLVADADVESLKSQIPLTRFVGNDGMFIIECFPNGDCFSELLSNFLVSYILGMIVRYYPSRWIALLRNEKGDAAQPVIKAVTKAIAVDFPRLAVEALN